MKDTPMTTPPEAVEAALKYAEVRHLMRGLGTFDEYLKHRKEFEPHFEVCDGVDSCAACIRILAARVRELEREREGSVERVGRLERALEAVIKSQPCMYEGNCFYPMHDGEGEPIGEQYVDPLMVIQGMVQIAGEALFDNSQPPQPEQAPVARED